ncbi:MAG: non-hydrolyzing UDP-N-acetylglucosamine 2-epimerase [Nitrospiraceae bacterium]
MKIVSIVGARPQFVKLAPLSRVFHRRNGHGGSVEHVIVHTGQHYNSEMSAVFFKDLEIPEATYHLGVDSGTHGYQTGRMLEGIEHVLTEIRPDMVVVYGDTDSTVAGSLTAAKLYIPIAHVEAGVRSFNRRMPEEINRVLTDHAADLLLAPTPYAMDNLKKEGLESRAVWTGDIMFDALLTWRGVAERHSQVLWRLRLPPRSYGVVTVHRAENTDDREKLQELLTVFSDIASQWFPLIFPVHPRTAKMIRDLIDDAPMSAGLRMIEPLGYLDMLQLVCNARMVLTDSGGLQKEAFFLECPCITLREETEWVETALAGANIIAGTDPKRVKEAVAIWETRVSRTRHRLYTDDAIAAFGGGRSAERICDALCAYSSGG